MTYKKKSRVIEYVRNESLKNLDPDWKGNPYCKGVYYNENERFQPGFKDIVKWQRNRRQAKRLKKQNPFSLTVHSDTSFLKSDRDVLVWMGHASFYLRLGGVSFLIDPCYSKLPMVKSYTRPAIGGKSITDLDYILYSHAHRDHFDVPTLRDLLSVNPEVKFLLPMDMGKLLKRYTSQPYQEAGWFQQFDLSELKIAFLPARHWNRRGLLDFNDMLWGGYWLEWKASNGKTKSIYFTGDTAYDSHFKHIGRIMGSPDIALMPVGAYNPDFIMKSSHTSPWEALQAYQDVGGKRFIPMHYGTYDLSDEPPNEPIEVVTKAFADSPDQLMVPEIGAPLWLDDLWAQE
ncbi:MBL fold metallo-hydrolase [bacterium SCSIO 12741]|nr:MBL fold metallo-hydrolase [bacterium SCSIO 12741]